MMVSKTPIASLSCILGIFLLFSHFSLASDANSSSTLSKRATGQIVYPTNGQGEIATDGSPRERSHKRRPVSLAQPPKSGEVPTLAADLNTAMMGPDMVKAMDDQYAQRLREFSMNNGFYATSQFSRHKGPAGRSPEDETRTRQEMAKSIQRYMLIRGIPKFLASKPDTKQIAKTYNDVVVMTKVEGKTKSRWEYKTGINPFQLRAFGNVSKDGWHFQSSTMYDKGGRYKLKDVYLSAHKSYRSGTYSTGCDYEVFAKHLIPGVGRSFSKNLNANLSTRMPLAALGVWNASVTTLAVTYAF